MTVMMKSFGKLAFAALLASSPLAVKAYDVVIDFDDLTDQAVVGAHYAGIIFSPNGLITTDGGDIGGGEPIQSSSPSSSLVFLGIGAGTISVPSGFTVGSLNLFFSNPYDSGTTITLSGGNLGAPIVFSLSGTDGYTFENWEQLSGTGNSVAQLITVSAGSESVAFDDFQLNFAPEGWNFQPENQPVPEPSTVIGGLALAALAASRMVRSRK